LGAALVGALALLFGIDGIEQLYARSQLQELANNAAMAGVQALQDSAGRDDVQRQSIAMAASRAVTATVTGADVSVVASVAPIYVAVEVAQSSGWLRRINGRLNVVGQAGYLAPPRSRNVQQAQIPDSSRDAL
jgi:Flp pilus assembly protein TadG